ncbi:MAG: hypothetical protein IPK61_03970 [Saprospiraceae bacterium]|nr:hypothetical protein [Saprospiraceae bacterium]
MISNQSGRVCFAGPENRAILLNFSMMIANRNQFILAKDDSANRPDTTQFEIQSLFNSKGYNLSK